MDYMVVFKSGFRILALCLALFLTALPVLADTMEAIDPDTYRINRGDVIGISVWREEALQSPEILVRPDGHISFPLVGNLSVAGKSVPEVTAEIATGLRKFIPDPEVHVTVSALNGNMVYVIGKVARPGVFPMNSQVDVVQALAMAGGMTPYAAANKVRILRREGGRQLAIPFAYGDIEKGEKLEQNILLQAGDVVLVP
jgi:polysaccharide export outer membrane protein